jgi:hypothetical protein
VVPCDVEVVPGAVDVVGAVCPIPGLGVTVPVVCAVAMPNESANTDEANKIFFINLLLLVVSAVLRSDAGKIVRSKFSCLMRCREGSGKMPQAELLNALFQQQKSGIFLTPLMQWTNAAVCFYPSACTMQ